VIDKQTKKRLPQNDHCFFFKQTSSAELTGLFDAEKAISKNENERSKVMALR